MVIKKPVLVYYLTQSFFLPTFCYFFIYTEMSQSWIWTSIMRCCSVHILSIASSTTCATFGDGKPLAPVYRPLFYCCFAIELYTNYICPECQVIYAWFVTFGDVQCSVFTTTFNVTRTTPKYLASLSFHRLEGYLPSKSENWRYMKLRREFRSVFYVIYKSMCQKVEIDFQLIYRVGYSAMKINSQLPAGGKSSGG